MARKDPRKLSPRMQDAGLGIMDKDTIEFIEACDELALKLGRPLMHSQRLEIILYLGYRKTAPKGEHKLWAD